MRRYLTGALPDHPLPEGLEMRPVTEDQYRAIFDADNEAFEDHWGHRAPEEADFQARFHGPDMTPAIWCVAWDGDQVAGVVMNAIFRDENEALGIRRAWLEHVSVRRPWRGRGVAKALCAASFRVLRDQGMDEAWLGVDGTNPTGALQLYEGLGFAVGAALDGVRATARPAGSGGLDVRDRGRSRLEREAALVADQLHPCPLAPDRRRGAVPREHPQPVLERAQPGDRRRHGLGVAAREVDAAPAAGEQRVAAEQEAIVGAEQADGALGVARGVQDAQPDLAEPDLAALGELHRRHGGDDLERRVQRLRRRAAGGRPRGWTAMSAPVWACTAALSPTWSQWPWVLTISFRVHSRSARAPAIQSRQGVAVSIAIASRVAGSART